MAAKKKKRGKWKKRAEKARKRKPAEKKRAEKAPAKNVPRIKLPQKKYLSEKELIALLSPKREIDLKVHKTFEEMPDKFCVILLEKLANYSMLNTRLVKYFVNRKMKGVYITVNKHLANLIETLSSEKVQIEDIIFIDAITALTGESKIPGSNFYYIDSPKNLVELSVQLEKALKKIGEEKKFVIMDSISTLLVYNKEATVEKFVHSLSGKIRANNAQGIFILVESGRKEVLSMLTQFCDKVIAL